MQSNRNAIARNCEQCNAIATRFPKLNCNAMQFFGNSASNAIAMQSENPIACRPLFVSIVSCDWPVS